jgi:TonB family protein
MRSRRGLAGPLVCSLGLGLLAGSETRAGDWRSGLEGPLTPGSVALLVQHAGDPAVPLRWSEALRDPRAAVRAAAARAVYASGTRAAAGDLREALKVETDATAEREETRALAVLGPNGELQTAGVSVTDVPAAAEPWRSMRRIGNLPAGLATETLVAAGCDVADGSGWAAANIQYGADGRPRTVSVWDSVAGGCREAARALFVLALPDREDAMSPTLVVMPFDLDALECASQAEGRASVPPVRVRADSQLREPVKVYDVKPVYPTAAKQERIQGLVILEAVIGPTGCIRDLRLIKSAHPTLDLAALLAVLRWRYTPTLLDGVPVPVIMTITVNFRLS